MKTIIVVLTVIALVCSTGMIVLALGSGTATVNNSTPVISSGDITDIGDVSVGTVNPNTEFWYYIVIDDADGAADIDTVVLDVSYLTTTYDNDPTQTYKFTYDHNAVSWTQNWPTAADNYINVGNCQAVEVGNQLTVRFSLTLNKTAKDTNTAADWLFRGSAVDDSAEPTNVYSRYFVMAPFIEMTYAANAGGMNFEWIGTAETTQSAPFTTTVTSNDQVVLEAQFSGGFGEVEWDVPTLYLKENDQAGTTNMVQDTWVVWYTSLTDAQWDTTLDHTLYLDFPAGLIKGTVYAGTLQLDIRSINT